MSGSARDVWGALQIGAERARAADLQQRVAQAQQRVDQQRRQMGGVRAAQDCDTQARLSHSVMPWRLKMLTGVCLWDDFAFK